MNVDIKIVNAFTVNGSGGNPAAVVLDGDRFTKEQKQQIAKLAGLSETAFVGSSDSATIKLEFFTPSRQIAHCGHATIATFSYLLQQGLLPKGIHLSKETVDGLRTILISGQDVYMEQKAPVYTQLTGQEVELILHAAGLRRHEARCCAVCNTGNGYILIEVNTVERLATLQPDQDLMKLQSERYGVIGYYVYAKTPGQSHDATARMFAPAYGIAEEAGTGMAAGPLACYLYAQDSCKDTFTIEQGRYMTPASPSLIRMKLKVADGAIQSLMAGGTAALTGSLQKNI